MLTQKVLDTKMLDTITWKYLGDVTGKSSLALPANWKELHIEIESTSGGFTTIAPFNVFREGTYNNGRFSSNNGQITFAVGSVNYALQAFYVGTTDNSANTISKIWYR